MVGGGDRAGHGILYHTEYFNPSLLSWSIKENTFNIFAVNFCFNYTDEKYFATLYTVSFCYFARNRNTEGNIFRNFLARCGLHSNLNCLLYGFFTTHKITEFYLNGFELFIHYPYCSYCSNFYSPVTAVTEPEVR